MTADPTSPEPLNAELLARIVELERRIVELQAEVARRDASGIAGMEPIVDKPIDPLQAAGMRLIAAAKEYWVEAQKAGMSGAVIWMQDTAGGLAIYTRGEYREILMRNIEYLGPTRSFGSADPDA